MAGELPWEAIERFTARFNLVLEDGVGTLEPLLETLLEDELETNAYIKRTYYTRYPIADPIPPDPPRATAVPTGHASVEVEWPRPHCHCRRMRMYQMQFRQPRMLSLAEKAVLQREDKDFKYNEKFKGMQGYFPMEKKQYQRIILERIVDWQDVMLDDGPEQSSIEIPNLVQNTTYEIRMRGKNVGGWGAWSEPSAVKTEETPATLEVLTPRTLRRRNMERHRREWRKLQTARRKQNVCMIQGPGGKGTGFYCKMGAYHCILTAHATIHNADEAMHSTAVFWQVRR
jgi:hypothetical protein